MNNEDGHTNSRGVPIYGRRPTFREAIADKLPPQHIEAEQSFLGSILLDPAMMERVVEWLKVEHFYRDAHRLIYGAMMRVYGRGTPPDILLVAEELKEKGEFDAIGDDDYLTELVEGVPHAANGAYYGGIVEEKGRKRGLVELAADLVVDGYSDQFTADQLLERASAGFASLERPSVDDEDDLDSEAPPRMAAMAFRGLAGEIVSCIDPQTEACREAILMQLIVASGNLFGIKPHYVVGGTSHRCNLYLCVVGPTGCGKGMAWDAVECHLGAADEKWTAKPFLTGMTSGEGVIVEAKEMAGPVLAIETEFARTINNMNREGNSLNAILRQAFESTRLRIPTKNSPIIVENAHLSLIAHVPPNELKGKLSAYDVENGLVNRFLWCHAYLSKLLPGGGDFASIEQALAPLLTPLVKAVSFAESLSRPFRRDRAAEELWHEVYPRLRMRQPGPHGSATARAAALTMRLAMIYAIYDRSREICLAHLQPALAAWDYCDATAKSIFGDGRQDRKMDKLITALEQAKDGLPRKDIRRKVFGAHLSKDELTKLLEAARASGQIVYTERPAGCTNLRVWMHRKYIESAPFAPFSDNSM